MPNRAAPRYARRRWLQGLPTRSAAKTRTTRRWPYAATADALYPRTARYCCTRWTEMPRPVLEARHVVPNATAGSLAHRERDDVVRSVHVEDHPNSDRRPRGVGP